MGWVWTAWLLLVFGSFAMLEGYALETDRMTLSRWVWSVTEAFPAFPWIVGVVVGFLACHFFWGGVVPFKPVGKLLKAVIGD